MEQGEDVTYTSVVIKTKKLSEPEGLPVSQKMEEETVYDEVKVHSEATIQPLTNSSAVLVPDKKEEGRRHLYRKMAWCFGTLFVISLLGVIGVCTYFAFLESESDQLQNNQTALLNENIHLTNLNNRLSADFDDLRKDHSNLTVQFDGLLKAFSVSESRIANLTEEKQKLESETRNLTEQIKNLETSWKEHNVSRSQWSIDAYCPRVNNAVLARTCKACQTGWSYSQSSCYAINNAPEPERKTWEKAREDCREKNSDLVVVSDDDEKKFVNDHSWGSSGTEGYWVGLKAEDNKWKWIDGSDLTHDDWVDREADKNHCVISVTNKGWESVLCSEKQQWICEKMALSV